MATDYLRFLLIFIIIIAMGVFVCGKQQKTKSFPNENLIDGKGATEENRTLRVAVPW